MNTKKSLAITALSLLLGLSGYTQQVPLYNQYHFIPYLHNPARVGQVYEVPSAFAIFRKQWMDMPGAPVTEAFSLDGAVLKKKVGLGVYVVNDNTNIINQFSINLAYSYRLAFDDKQGLMFGIMTGFADQKIDFDKVVVHDPNDKDIFSNSGKDMSFDAGAGLNYYWKNLNVGISVPQLVSKNFIYLDNYNEASYSPIQHFIVSADYKFWLKKDVFTLEPIGLLTYVKNAPLKYDIGVLFGWKDKAWLGATYRSNYAVSFTGGVKLNNSLIIAYNYDYATNELAKYAGGSHEFMIGYLFGGKRASDYDKMLKEHDMKLTKLSNKVDSLGKEVDTLAARDTVFEKSILEIRDILKDLRVNTEKIVYEAQAEIKLPKFAGIVLYKTNSYAIEDIFRKDLDDLIKILKQYPDLRIDLRGHTDNVGSEYYNDKLSDNRAKSVKAYLVANGIGEDRISVNGLGERFPRVPNSSDNNKSLNRRTEIAVYKGLPTK